MKVIDPFFEGPAEAHVQPMCNGGPDNDSFWLVRMFFR